MTTVREWLGHSAVSVTDIYAHALAPTEAVRALLDLIGPHTRGGVRPGTQRGFLDDRYG